MEMDGWMGAPGPPFYRPVLHIAQNKAPLKWMLAACLSKVAQCLQVIAERESIGSSFVRIKKDSMMWCVIFECLTLNVKWQVIQSDCPAAAAV